MSLLHLVETSLRHGQETLLVSRLRLRHILPVAEQLDRCGFSALDVFGGATFEACVRFLAEDPWERLIAIRAAAPVTPLLAAISGQALVGHRHVADDLVDLFIETAAAAGIDVFRCHDPLNDIRNLARCAAAVQSCGKQAEGVIVYSDSPRHDADEMVAMGTRLVGLGYDSVCLWDPLGLLGIRRTGELVARLVDECNVPVGLSVCARTGQAELVYQTAAIAGASRIDVALAPLAGGPSVPSAEAIVAAFHNSDIDTGMALRPVMVASAALETVLIEYADILDPRAARLDTSALAGLLPPSAMGDAITELRERDAFARIDDIESEVVRIRQELGSPPFVTPITDIIATQAVYNVCDGDRYATISQEVKDYCLGLYGTPPWPMDDDVRRAVSGRDEPITGRPADMLEPGVPVARRALGEAGVQEASSASLVSYGLFGEEWLALVDGRARPELLAGEIETTPADSGGPDPDSHREAMTEVEVPTAAPSPEVRELTVEVDGEEFSVRVSGPPGTFGDPGGSNPRMVAAPAPPAKLRAGTVTAPMQGMIVKVPVSVGDPVKAGDVVAVLEAMKMENDIAAVTSGTVTAVLVQAGTVVGARDPLVQVD